MEEQILLVQRPDLESDEENEKREKMLLHDYRRSPILERLETELH